MRFADYAALWVAVNVVLFGTTWVFSSGKGDVFGNVEVAAQTSLAATLTVLGVWGVKRLLSLRLQESEDYESWAEQLKDNGGK